jgi:hypothetical protein
MPSDEDNREELLFDGWPCDIPTLMRLAGPVQFAWMIIKEPTRWSWGVPTAIGAPTKAGSLQSGEPLWVTSPAMWSLYQSLLVPSQPRLPLKDYGEQ